MFMLPSRARHRFWPIARGSTSLDRTNERDTWKGRACRPDEAAPPRLGDLRATPGHWPSPRVPCLPGFAACPLWIRPRSLHLHVSPPPGNHPELPRSHRQPPRRRFLRAESLVPDYVVTLPRLADTGSVMAGTAVLPLRWQAPVPPEECFLLSRATLRIWHSADGNLWARA